MKKHMIAIVAASTVLGGIRSGPSVAAAQGRTRSLLDSAVEQKVHVTTFDGSRATGRLVSLSDTEVVLRRGSAEHRLPLRAVQRVERAGHKLYKWALWGAAGGGGVATIIGYRSYTGDGMSGDEVAGTAVAWGAVGAAVGGGLGASVDKGNKLLYEAPGTSRSVSVLPVVLPGRQAVAFTMQW